MADQHKQPANSDLKTPTLSDWRYNQEVYFTEETVPSTLWNAVKDVEDLADRLRARHEDRHKQQIIPDILYHYTDVGGLHGMLSNHNIWLTDAAFMNDPLEGTWVHRRASTLCSEIFGSSPLAKPAQAQIEAHLLSSIIGGPLEHGEVHDPSVLVSMDEAVRPGYIASFTAADDLLSQWRGYGDGGAGVAIGFSLNDLSTCSINLFGYEYRPVLIKVEYDQKVQDAEIRAVLGSIAEIFEKHSESLLPFPHAHDFFVAKFYEPIREALYWLRWEYKSPHYQEEEEWRLVINPFGFQFGQSKTRISKGTIVPYVEIPIPRIGTTIYNTRLSIPRIVLGPTCPPSTAKGIRAMLSYAEIVPSELSLR